MEQRASPLKVSATQVVVHFKRALAAEESITAKLQAALKELTVLRKSIADLPDKARHNVRVPFGPLASFPGQLMNINELPVHSGDNKKQTSKQTIDILDRRKASLESQLHACQKKVVELRDRVQAAERLAETDGGGLLEIREEYVEEVHGAGAMRPAQQGNAATETERKEGRAAGGKDAPREDPEFDALMARLEELEAAELRGDEDTGQESDSFKEQTRKDSVSGSARSPGAQLPKEGPGSTKRDKRVRFAAEASEGRQEDLGEGSVGVKTSTVPEKREKVLPLVGQIVERMDTQGENERSGSLDEMPAAAIELAETSEDENEERRTDQEVEEMDSEEEEDDRHFFEALRAEASDGSSEEEEEEENSDEDTGESDEEGPSLETGRQVSADIQQWLARKAPGGRGVASPSAYARESRAEDARARLRQRAEQLRNERERQLGGATTAESTDTGAPAPLGQPSSSPAHDQRPQFASQEEKEAAFHQFLYGEPAIVSGPDERPGESEMTERKHEKAVLGGIVERQGAPDALEVPAAQDTVVTRPKSRFKAEMQRRAGGS